MKDIVKLILELADQQINIFLEDGKLKVDAPNGIVLDAVISKIRQHRDGIIEYLSGNKHNSVVEIGSAPLTEGYPLSSSQRRLWVLSQFEEGSIAYNIPGVFKFEGMLDIGALSKSFATLIDRHESLRTVFREAADGEIKQYILAPETLGFQIGYHNFDNNSEVIIKQALLNSLSRPFDLENGPLLRADLYQAGDNKWIFSYVMHHIISDGWSMEILIKELLQLYDIYVKGQTSLLPPLGIHYKDYAVWQQERLGAGIFEQHKQYWLEQFSGELPVLEFPADKVRPAVKTYNGASLHKQIDGAITAGLKGLCHSEGSTLFMVLLAGIKTLLYRYTGQEDIIIGSPIAGREHGDLEGQIGFYVNTLALRTQFSGTDSFQQLLTRVKQVTLHAYEHQSYPFDALLEELDVQRDMSRSALFDVLLVLQHQSGTSLIEKGLAGLDVSTYEGLQQGSKFDLQFSFVEEGDQLHVHIAYNTDIYHNNTISQLASHLEQLLGAIIARPGAAIGTLEYLSIPEQTMLLETFNATTVPYALNKTVVDLFEEQVLRTPDHIGLLYEEETFNYQHLNETANQLAHYLKRVYNISADDLIGVQLERNEWLVIALLGILKSGGAYVPIDPRYPKDRIDFIVSDSRCKVVLDEKELNKFRTDAAKYSCLNPVKAVKSTDLAYVIYTSGSTGRPKGVMITHSNVYAFMEWCKEEFSDAGYEVVLGVTSVCFDLSVFEIFYTLVSGKRLRLLADALSIQQHLNCPEPLLLNTVPGVVSNLLSVGADLSSVSVLNMAGEPIPAHTISQLDCNRIAIRNLYGPSEDTTYSTVYRINSAERILIGHPISNTRIYILSDQHQLQPVGVAGEICISGAGLARGYLNRDSLTAEKFISNPFIAGERLYKTGDLGKWQPDGNIAFLGRKDDQVKIRGHRIELGEITEVLHGYPDVAAAAVTVIKDNSGDNLLTAYVAGKHRLDLTALRSWLSLKLPQYMLPSHFIQLESLPLLPNGKLNKKALPAPLETGTEYVAPRNQLETQLVEIWMDILGKEQIGVKDNFFGLGGHSLKVTRLASSLYKVLGVKVPLKELFTATSVEAQAILIAQSQQGTYAVLPAAPEQAYYPLSSSQHRLWTLSQFEGGSVAYNITNVIRIEGNLDITLLQQAVDLLIERHESLRTVFKPDESGVIYQYILPVEKVNCKIQVHHVLQADDTQQVISDLTNHAFNLEEAPLFRIEVIQIDETSRLLLFNLHHIVGDGWSMEVISAEVVAWYNSLKQGIAIKMPPLSIQYKDYAYWSATVLQEASKTYWHKQLSGELPVLELPIAKPRPKLKTYNGGLITHTFNTVFTHALKNKATEQEATLFMALMAGINGLLYRYTGQTDIITGTPVAGRNHSVLENQVGLYLNTLAIRTRFECTDTFNELIQKQKNVLLESYAHQDYPFDALLSELSIKRDTSRSALFDIMVVLHNQQDIFKKGAGFIDTVATTYPKQTNQASQFDISFSFAEDGNHIKLSVSYNTDIYTAEAIKNIVTYLEHFIIEGIRNPQHSIARINYLPEEELQQLLSVKNTGAVEKQTLLDLIENSFRENADDTALIFDNRTITYRTLDEQSNQLAHYLLHTHAISPGDLIGIKLERTEWLIITILAVLKTGAAYVPIDIHYPEERIGYIENDSACKLSITKDLLKDFSQQEQYIITRPVVNLLPEDLAYIIYTSGSTGKPKGVMLTHANVVAFLHWCKKEFATTDFDIVYASTSHCFDLSVYEMFFPLSIGKPLRILPNGLSIGEYIAIDTKILINTVPSVVENLLDSGVPLDNVAAVNMAGEPVPIALSNTLCKYPIALRNLYGPSEDTTYSSCYRITGQHRQPLPIGKPIDDTYFYIMSEELTLQGEGLVGEICIAGKGLSKGYLNKTALTKEKFIDNPYVPGTQLYRTGDLGYLMPDGNIGFSGRKDEQVKLRGYRVEPGEIEYILQEESNINQAVVLIKELAGEKYIVAYLTGDKIEIEQLRGRLAGKLPGYMIPSHYLVLDSIPLTPNGKTDKNRLLGLEVIKLNTINYIAPKTDIEKQLVMIWEKILGVGEIGITDDFFELGGHSLHITRMLYEINNAFDLKLQMKTIYASQNIQELAQSIEDEIVFRNGITINATAQITNEKNSEIWEI